MGGSTSSMWHMHVNVWSVHLVVHLVLWKICSTRRLWWFGY